MFGLSYFGFTLLYFILFYYVSFPSFGSPFRLGCFFDFPFILFVSFFVLFFLCFYLFSYYHFVFVFVFVFVYFVFLSSNVFLLLTYVCMLCLSYPVLGHDIALSNALRCIISVS